jgi:hypothetical protein
MIRQVMFYHETTGELMNHVITGDEAGIALNTPASHKAITVTERIDPRKQVVDVTTGKLKLRPQLAAN